MEENRDVKYPPGTEVFYTPDVLPPHTWEEEYWYIANRQAENFMRVYPDLVPWLVAMGFLP